jgi:hypothetical protein
MSNVQTYRFHQIEIGQHFKRDERGPVYTKVSKSIAGIGEDGPLYPMNSQALVELVTETEASWEELDFHTFDFTPKQAADVIEQIVQRAVDQYGADRIDADRLRKGVYCAHRTKPARLIALLHTCNVDFPREILYGVYRHYDPETDTLRNGWTLQHSEPHSDPWAWLFGNDD